MTAEVRGGRFRDALRSRDLRILAGAFLIDGLGSWAYLTVLVVYVFERTGSTTWIALLTASGWVPRFLLSSYAGVLADKYERTRVMIVSALLSYFGMAALALVVATDGPLLLILTLSAVSAGVSTPYRPAAAAITPEVVPERDLVAANGLFSALESAVVVIGPGVGALLLLSDEASAAIQLNALSFLASALLVFRMRVRSTGDADEEGQSAYKAFLDGVNALRAERVALVLVLFCALDSAVYGASTVLYVPISEQLGTGNNGFGYLLAGSALGGVISAGIANRLSASRRLAPIIVGGIACQAIPFALTAFVHTPLLGFLLQVVAGTGMIIVDVLAVTALQRDMPRGVLGRVFSLLDVAVILAILLSSFIFAFILSATDLHPSLFILGIGFPAAALLGIGPLLKADRKAAAKIRELEPRVALLQVLDLFEAASQRVLENLADLVEVIEIPDNTDVVRQGEPADALWIVVDGEVSVTVDDQFVRTMGPRSYFGEIGLLRGIPRTATVRTSEPSVMWRLAGDDFLEAVQENSASTSLLGVAFSRLSRTHPRLVEDAGDLPATTATS